MINHVEASIQAMAIHFIGNRAEGEDIGYSAALADTSDPALEATLIRFMTRSFREPEFFQFHYPTGELELNAVYNFVANIFDDPRSLHEQSVHIARQLYDKSPQEGARPGYLLVTHLNNLLIDDEMCHAISIIKVENHDSFFQIGEEGGQRNICQLQGIPANKIEKGCLIFDLEREEGFRVVNIDTSQKNKDALYWRNDFLKLTARHDEYHQTRHYIQATKQFIQERMPKEFETDKADESAAMQRSYDYFSKNDQFQAQEYAVRVFENDQVVDAFKEYTDEYSRSKAMPLDDVFDISESAVRKQSKVFKSVIKLDKNFHIYVHGDRNKILKGTDEEGKKYYILYYDTEM